MRVDHDQEAGSGISVATAPLLDNSTADCIVRAEHLGKQVVSPEGTLVILDDISFAIARGESVAVFSAMACAVRVRRIVP